MRFIMMVKGTARSEAGVMPTPEQMAAMGAYNEQLTKAGVLVDAAGLKPTSAGAKVQYRGGKPTLAKGPFTGGDIVSGYWIIEAPSTEDAFAWATKAPNPAFSDTEGEIEVRPFFGEADFADAG
jgi:hypothetical protein